MAIYSNPHERRISVPAGNATVILILRHFTNPEYLKFINRKAKIGRRGKLEDNSNELRINFIDTLLTGIEGEDEKGNPVPILHVDKDGSEKPITPDLENWKALVNPSWKLSAALYLDADTGEAEERDLKN